MMPEVKNCTVIECFYNNREICHANAIQVGSDHQACDTFITIQTEHGAPASIAAVGACHQSDCKFNDSLSCHAGSINVDRHEKHADCVTYEPFIQALSEEDELILTETQAVSSEGSRSFHLEAPPPD